MKLNTLKKTLAGAMVALMACTSMSAFAKPEWVPVGLPTHSGKLNEGTFSAKVSESLDETCANWLVIVSSVNPFGYTYKLAPGKSWITKMMDDTGAYLSCYSLWWWEAKGYWHDSGAPSSSGTLTCEKGEFSYDAAKGTIGCYKYLDCDPALYPDGKLPEGCPEFSRNDPICEDKRTYRIISPDTGKYTEIGGVGCTSDDDMHTCFWPEDTLDATDSDARKIIRACAIEHEKTHTSGKYGRCDAYYQRHVVDDTCTRWLSEIEGYSKETACLNDNISGCGANENCDADVKTRIQAIGIASSGLIMSRIRTKCP